MSDTEKLKIACDALRVAIRNGNLNIDYQKRWQDFALRGSIQTRKAKSMKNYARG